MIAALLRRAPLTWRSTQLTLALSVPPRNHLACGGFHSSTRDPGGNHSSPFAKSAQTASGTRPGRATSRSLPGVRLLWRGGLVAGVIGAELDLFGRDHTDGIDEARERLEAYNRADRDEAEELYGDYVDAVETGTELLADLRDHYARSLDDPDRYCEEFNRAVAKRMPAFALEIENR